MRGPWSFVSQEWGLVVEGFTPSPVVMAPYNPSYYIDHIASFNLEKDKGSAGLLYFNKGGLHHTRQNNDS